MENDTVRIEARFCGPPGTANGGYLAGLLAAKLGGGGAEVTIRRPIPLDRELRLDRAGDGLDLFDGDTHLAGVRPASLAIAPPPAVSPAEAALATRAFPRFTGHPIPRCFVCGPERTSGDGLRILPGPVPGRESIYASPWTPDESLADESGTVRPEHLWAALDCIGAFAVNEPPRGLALLGKLAAEILNPVAAGEPLVVVGWPISRDGRKLHPGTAILGAAGDLRAIARATWILTSPP
jgi:hypothetical protein